MNDMEKVIKLLEQCLQNEETALPIYSRHTENPAFLSEFSDDKKIMIEEMLEVLRRDTSAHIDYFRGVLNKLKKA